MYLEYNYCNQDYYLQNIHNGEVYQYFLDLFLHNYLIYLFKVSVGLTCLVNF